MTQEGGDREFKSFEERHASFSYRKILLTLRFSRA